MSAVTPVEKIRIAIADQLSHFGLQRPESLHETMLIRNGLFCGRKFQADSFVVVWFIEEDEIKFFNPSGELIKATSAIHFVREFEQQPVAVPQLAVPQLAVPQLAAPQLAAPQLAAPQLAAPQRRAA